LLNATRHVFTVSQQTTLFRVSRVTDASAAEDADARPPFADGVPGRGRSVGPGPDAAGVRCVHPCPPRRALTRDLMSAERAIFAPSSARRRRGTRRFTRRICLRDARRAYATMASCARTDAALYARRRRLRAPRATTTPRDTLFYGHVYTARCFLRLFTECASSTYCFTPCPPRRRSPLRFFDRPWTAAGLPPSPAARVDIDIPPTPPATLASPPRCLDDAFHAFFACRFFACRRRHAIVAHRDNFSRNAHAVTCRSFHPVLATPAIERVPSQAAAPRHHRRPTPRHRVTFSRVTAARQRHARDMHKTKTRASARDARCAQCVLPDTQTICFCAVFIAPAAPKYAPRCASSAYAQHRRHDTRLRHARYHA